MPDEQKADDCLPIRCPYCNCAVTRVVWTRPGAGYADGKRRRKRQCGLPICGKTFLGRVEQAEIEKVVGGKKNRQRGEIRQPSS
jgi:transcriptional regulator NrdR family protein